MARYFRGGWIVFIGMMLNGTWIFHINGPHHDGPYSLYYLCSVIGCTLMIIGGLRERK